MTVTENASLAAQTLVDACGASPAIKAYGDEARTWSVDIALFADRPVEGFSTAGTVSLSDHGLGLEQGLRIEIVAVFPAAADAFPQALASSAVAAISQGWRIRRGAVHPDILRMYDLSDTLEHLLFAAPYLWGDALAPVRCGDLTIAWLLAVPISEAERAYAEKHGAVALENLLAEHKIDITDLNRASVAPVE